jgi:adenylate cyclase
VTEQRVQRRLAAILAADVVGYSALMQRAEEATYAEFERLKRELIEPSLCSHEGRLIKTTGDGALVEFASPLAAVRCAVEIQDHLASGSSPFRLRVGINLGDVIVGQDGELYGDGINIAVRLEGIADPGGILVSEKVYSEVEGKLDVSFQDRGGLQLKNISRPIRAYAVRAGAHSVLAEGLATAPPLPDKPSIAVLPFQNLSGDPEQEYFADGMVEEVITALSRNRELFVIARNSSFAFKGKPVDIKQVARDLGVRYVLEGSVRKSGNRIRITGQLIDAASGAHLWADRFDGALEDVFELQDQVASSVVGAITPSIIHAEMERAKRKPTSSLDAYDYYLRGRAARWQLTRDGTDQAIALYERAIALDPQFAPAHSSLAMALGNRRSFGWSTDPAADASRAKTYAKSALDLDRQDPLVLTESGNALLISGHGDEFELAASLFEEAIRLDPNGMSGWTYGGWAKITLGNYQTAIDYFQRALRLSPLDPRIFVAQGGLAYAHFFLGNYEEGLKHASAAFHHHPNYGGALRAAMACNALLGNIEAAQKLWQQVAKLSPSDRVSETRKRWQSGFRSDKDLAKLQEAYRLAGMPE